MTRNPVISKLLEEFQEFAEETGRGEGNRKENNTMRKIKTSYSDD